MMTALDVFMGYGGREKRIEDLEERIRRREAVATGGGVRAPDADGGRSGEDASMRLLDYVGNVEQLRAELQAARKERDEDKACAIYLTEMLPETMGKLMSRVYLEKQPLKTAAKAMGYSATHARRLLKEAEDICKGMQIVSWDRVHVPVLAIPDRR